jgi:hypothetical protein
VSRLRPIALAGIGAALLGNYWVLEEWLARRSDLSASWISDLAARSEALGWRFEAMEIASGLAVLAFAALLLPRLGELSPIIRFGIVALLAEGVFTVVGGAAPLSCAENLDPSCTLDYDVLDVLHATAELVATAATVLAFGLVGLGLTRLSGQRNRGRATLVLGLLWLVLAVLTGVSYLNGDVDSVKGLCQRGGQLLFGAWLIMLGVWAGRPSPPSERLATGPSRQ